jgi:tetratricopeptide (TPR) repeat protein
MDETVREIERALADRSQPHPLHPWAMTCLFDYFRGRGDMARAAHYGWEMFRSEPVNAPTLGALVDVLIRADRRDQARQCLQSLASHSANEPNPYLAWALLHFGQAYQDRQAIIRAANMFRVLLSAQPDQSEFLRGLGEAERLLGKPPTQPSPTTSPSSTRRPPPGAAPGDAHMESQRVLSWGGVISECLTKKVTRTTVRST